MWVKKGRVLDMKNNGMHITMVLDRSGSMGVIRDDVVGGVNLFLERQRKDAAEATLTLVQFDTEDPFEVVHSFLPVTEVPPLTADTFCPRGGTPLLDATGRTIVNLENWLAKLPAAERPEKLLIVVVTDGQENSSREFTAARVKQLIAEKKEMNGWQFVYLSADLEAIDDAIRSGYARDSVMAFDKTEKGTKAMFSALAENTILYSRRAAPSVQFSAADRAKQENERVRS